MRALLKILHDEERVVDRIVELERDIGDLKRQLDEAMDDKDNFSMRSTNAIDRGTQRLNECGYRLEAERKYLSDIRKEIDSYLRTISGCDS